MGAHIGDLVGKGGKRLPWRDVRERAGRREKKKECVWCVVDEEGGRAVEGSGVFLL